MGDHMALRHVCSGIIWSSLSRFVEFIPGQSWWSHEVAEEKSDSEQRSILTLKRSASAHPVHQLDNDEDDDDNNVGDAYHDEDDGDDWRQEETVWGQIQGLQSLHPHAHTPCIRSNGSRWWWWWWWPWLSSLSKSMMTMMLDTRLATGMHRLHPNFHTVCIIIRISG